MGYLQIAARTGSALAPWVAKGLIVVHVVLPFSIMGGSAVVAAILLYWLPETAHMKTLETLHDQLDKKKMDSGDVIDETDGEAVKMMEMKELTA